jgi:hypothetical protein
VITTSGYAPEPTPESAWPKPGRPNWGVGDVWISAGVFLAAQFLVVFGLIATGAIHLQTDSGTATDTVSSGGLALLTASVMANWIGFGVWPTIAVYLKGSKSLARDLGLSIRLSDAPSGIVGGLVVFGLGIAVNIIFFIFSGGHPAPDNGSFLEPASHSLGADVLLFLLVAVGTPLFEELFFRGMLLRSIAKRYGLTKGVIISSLVFGALHAQFQGWSDLYLMTLLSLYGLVLATVCVRSGGRLGPSMIAHGINNGIAVLLLVLH